MYLLLANLYLGIFYMLYHGLLRKETFFQWNRVYLLTSLLLAYTLPLITVNLNGMQHIHFGGVLPEVSLASPTVVADHETPSLFGYVASLNYPLWLLYVYVAGCCIAMGHFIVLLFQTINHSKNVKGSVAYSFFGFIHIDNDVQEDERIRAHERIHVRQWHSLDIMLVQLVKVFNWFNPVVYLYEQAIKLQHEYIADIATAKENRIAYAELLISRAFSTYGLMLANEFANKSSVNQRVSMLLKTASSKRSLLRLIWVLPVLVGMLLFSVACNQAAKDNHSVAEDAQNTAEDTTETPFTESLTLALKVDDAKGNSLIETPEINAEPPGGMKSFMDYVAKTYKYPQEALEAEVNGMIQVSFVIDEAGELSDIRVVRDLGYGTGDAAVELLQNGPKWSPAIHQGKPVPSSYTLPIRLNLSN